MPAFRHARGGQENPAVYRRNVLRLPAQTNVDFSIGKQFNVRERQYVEFRAEFFNRFNQVNLANPISDLNAVAVPGGSSQCGDRTDHQSGIVRPDHLGQQ
jgi:hypothetical protein